MIENSEQEEIKILEAIIKKNAFKVKTFSYPQSQNEINRDQIRTCTKMYTLSKRGEKTFYIFDCFKGLQKYKTVGGIKEISGHADLIKIYEHSFIMKQFISELANCILDYKKETNKEEMEKQSKDYIDETLIEVEKFIINKKCFIKRTVNKAMAVLNQDPGTQVFEYYNLHGDRLTATENYHIQSIISLYYKYWPNFSRRMIFSNLAHVFAAVDFWDDQKGNDKRIQKYFERVKNHVRSIEKYESEYIF